MMKHISLDLVLYHACGRPRLSQTQPFLFGHYDEITISSWGFATSCSSSDSEYRIFFHILRVNGIYLCVSLLKTAGSQLSPQAETLYITHYKIRMCTPCWKCTNLRFCLPVWENKQCVSSVSPPLPHSRKLSPASASTLSSPSIKILSLRSLACRGALSQHTLFFTPRTKTTLQMTGGMWCQCTHTKTLCTYINTPAYKHTQSTVVLYPQVAQIPMTFACVLKFCHF